MTVFDWFLVGFWVLSMMLTISAVGKPRKPIEPGAAVISNFISLALIVGLLLTRGAL